MISSIARKSVIRKKKNNHYSRLSIVSDDSSTDYSEDDRKNGKRVRKLTSSSNIKKNKIHLSSTPFKGNFTSKDKGQGVSTVVLKNTQDLGEERDSVEPYDCNVQGELEDTEIREFQFISVVSTFAK